MNGLLGALNWLEHRGENLLAALIASVTTALAWMLRRGRFRAWRRSPSG